MQTSVNIPDNVILKVKKLLVDKGKFKRGAFQGFIIEAMLEKAHRDEGILKKENPEKSTNGSTAQVAEA